MINTDRRVLEKRTLLQGFDTERTQLRVRFLLEGETIPDGGQETTLAPFAWTEVTPGGNSEALAAALSAPVQEGKETKK